MFLLACKRTKREYLAHRARARTPYCIAPPLRRCPRHSRQSTAAANSGLQLDGRFNKPFYGSSTMGRTNEEAERLICAVCLKFEADTLPHLEAHWAVHFKHYLPDSDEEDEADDDGVASDQGTG